jgi:hypothetical protein
MRMLMRGVAAAVALASATAWGGDRSDDSKALRGSSGTLQPAAAAPSDASPGRPGGERTAGMISTEGGTGRRAGSGGVGGKAGEVPKSANAEPESPEKEFLHVWPPL